MLAFYTDEFVLPLPKGHRFPMQKYRMLRENIALKEKSIEFRVPRSATRGELALAHCPRYVDAVFTGQLNAEQQKDIGFPWSKAMVERSLRSVGATIEASYAAMQDGASVNLAGGTHHAHKAKGGGFCVFNDQVVASRVLQAHMLAAGQKEPHILIIDLDVHQGDGTATLTLNDPTIFSLSFHGETNYPFEKALSDLDMPLPKGCDDATYLSALEEALNSRRLVDFNPDIVFYLAGHDAHKEDRLGHLNLTDEGIATRNQLVFEFALNRACPIVMSMGGGYFNDLERLVHLQTQTITELGHFCTKWNNSMESAN